MKTYIMNIKNNVTYVIKSFGMIKMKNRKSNYTKKVKVTVILHENLEELLIIFVI